MAGPTKVTPWCTIFLVAGALTAHTLVLYGNLTTSRMLGSVGQSTQGWSNVGMQLAGSLLEDLEPAMATTATYLTSSIEVVEQIQKSTDVVLTMSGSTTDSALEHINKVASNMTGVEDIKAQVMDAIRTVVHHLMDKITPLINKFLELMRPALDKMQEWLTTFGGKIQAHLEEFGATMDKAQKMFDQVMAQASPAAGLNADVMVYNTFTLFDSDNSGEVQAGDLQEVSGIFGIPALSGDKPKQLVKKYDADGGGGLDEEEFANFVEDPAIPGIMAVVLRKYAKTLATIGGQVKAAKKRDEVAVATVNYLTLVCAKNHTRVEWIAQAFTNGSLPLKFTSSVLKELAQNQDNPNAMGSVDVGADVVGAMLELGPDHIVKMMKLVGSAAWWDSEGFDVDEMPSTLASLAGWLAASDTGKQVLEDGLGLDDGGSKDDLVSAAYRVGKEQSRKFSSDKAGGHAEDAAALYASQCAQVLRDRLLGGTAAAAAGRDEEGASAIKGGKMALPATLEFARWLSFNATSTSNLRNNEAAEYMGTTSSALQAFATEVNGMVSKTQNLLNLISTYASPHGVDRLVNQSLEFVKDATEDVVIVCEDYVDSRFAALECELNIGTCNATLASPDWVKHGIQDLNLELTGAFAFITDTLHDLKVVLPPALKNMKYARKEVTSLSHGLSSVMTVLGLKAPPLFAQLSEIVKTVWVAYYVLFFTLTVAMLLYGFWASGWFGGPQVHDDDGGYQAPTGVVGRLRAVRGACCACFSKCGDTALCFWSAIILMEILVLVLFLITIAVCILGGVKAFLAAGCSQVYILGDNTICTTAMVMLRTFLKTFDVGGVDVSDLCTTEKLMTCQVIKEEAMAGLLLAIFGAVVATLLSMQMVVEMAILHERAYYSRKSLALAKEK